MADESWDAFIEDAGDVFNPLPEGEYDFTITDAEGKVSSTGNPMVRVSAKVVSGPNIGKEIKDFYVIRSKSQAKKFMLHMRAMGISMETLMQHKPTMQQLAAVMVGKMFRGNVVHTSDKKFGDAVELAWAMMPPESGAFAVTEFPALTEGESLGYSNAGAAVATDDAAF